MSVTREALSPAMIARYGLSPRPAWQRALGISLIAVLVGLLAFGGWRLANPDITYKVLAFSVQSDSAVSITFEVRRPSDRPVVCVIRAQGGDRTDVGYATVTITPGRAYVQPAYLLRTRATAFIVEVLGCALDQPPEVLPPQFPPGTTNPPQVSVIDGA